MTVPNSHPFFAPQTLARLQGLPLRARRIVEGYVAGLHRSPFRGHSIEFAEHREYAAGDDLKHVDWKVFARTDKFYVKQFEDETNLICYLTVDTSASMLYRGPSSPLSKLEYAQCLAASLAWLVLHQQDAVALATFDSELRDSLSPSNSAAHWPHVLRVLESVRPAHRTQAGKILHELAEKFRKRGVVVVVSDLLDDVGSLAAGLKHLRHQRHDVVVFHVLDAAELDFPFPRPLRFCGLESDDRIVVDPVPLRRMYLRELRNHLAAVRACCLERSIDYRLVRTDQPLDEALAALLLSRSRWGGG
ncbi:MAG: DUF58 domain-containing protein [Pirellulaceae bacterium]